MRKVLTAIAATAFFSVAAIAAEGEGTVQSVDPASRTIVLEDGMSYTADEEVDLTALAPGDSVTIMIDDTTTSAISVEKQQ